MISQLELNRDALVDLCHKWHIRELSIFGSALRDDFGPVSDVDFLVSFEPGLILDIDRFLTIKEELEIVCGRPVDLVEKETLRNPWRKREILKTLEVIYAA